jgi:aspartyl-tRNA(Asn)/glutamyl-tRNA(Gln) amidotransferase subunit A
MADGGGEKLHYLSIRELARRIRRRELSPVEVARATLERIDALDGALNSFITVMRDQALADAERAERAIRDGDELGPLHGIPIGLKDLYQTRGVRTTGGSPILADWVPDEDAAAVERLRRAGAILIGKNNLHEVAFGVTGENPHYGATRNPWDRERVPGGSSSGSAAAVAAGLCWASLGSDTGGSIRLPAALCGVVGLKPTYGRVSRHGILPLAWSLDHAGPLARTVDDVAIVMNAIAGYDRRDPASADRPAPDFAAGLDGGVEGLRIGLLDEYLGEGVEAVVADAVHGAAEVLRGLGARVEDVSVPVAAHALGASTAVLFAEAAAVHERWLSEHRDRYGADVRARLEMGARLSAIHYLKGQRARRVMLEAFTELFERVDVVASPTVPLPAPTFEEVRSEASRGGLVRFTRLFNLLGLPACSLPCGFSSGGLPIGLQLIGRPFDEQTVLRAAHAYEQRAGWSARRPPV